MLDQSRNAVRRFADLTGAGAVAGVILLSGLNAALLDTGAGNIVEFLGGAFFGAAVAGLSLTAVAVLLRLTRAVSLRLAVVFIAMAIAAWALVEWEPAEVLRTLLDPSSREWPLTLPTGLDTLSVLILVMSVGLITGVAGLAAAREFGRPARSKRLLAAAAAVGFGIAALALILGLIDDGSDPYETDFSTFGRPALEPPSALADPAARGPFKVITLSYGAGENRRRPEFGDDRDLASRTVDATALLPEWKGLKARMRERFWGFGLDEAPLNGLVWSPEGEGPFPLVLIVHGNHGMEDYSDAGYAYLGELFASRGYIAASVDQNFINGSWSGDFRGKEMPARAWLLLEHLSLWRDWNLDATHRFGGRVDMGNVALIGHSRGGEAVSIAFAYNDLPAYPDDATVIFDYGFNIRSLVAIAQVDQRYHRRVELSDVSFLALQGSYDSDEPAFHGLRQFNRIAFSGADRHFKAGLYIHGANHGQFNASWGRHDYSPPGAWLLNTAPIIPGEDQRHIAAVYISAFLDATLKNDRRYEALFRDPRIGADWLPDHPYVHQYRDSTFVPIANFDEDIDVTTGTAPGATIGTQGFRLWREEPLRHRDERLQGTSAVVLGWSMGDEPVYTIALPEGFRDENIGGDDFLTLSITASTEALPDEEDDAEDNDAPDDEDSVEAVPPRVTIEALRTDGTVTRADSAGFATLAPPFKVQYLKHRGENDERYNDAWEPVLQYLELPLSAIGGDTPDRIRAIRLRFDQMPGGVVIVDDLGIRKNLEGE